MPQQRRHIQTIFRNFLFPSSLVVLGFAFYGAGSKGEKPSQKNHGTREPLANRTQYTFMPGDGALIAPGKTILHRNPADGDQKATRGK